MKIAGYMVTKNGLSGFIRTAIESLYNTTDYICVLDNGSTDGTKEWLEQTPKVDKVMEDDRSFDGNISKLRQKAINGALKADPDWILALDDDEQIVKPTVIRQQLKKHPANTIAFNLYHLWNDTEYRIDGTWQPAKVPHYLGEEVSEVDEIEIGAESNHCPRIPVIHDKFKLIADAEIIHYGWRYKDDELRKTKMEHKAEHDPDLRDIQEQHYNSIYEEPELKELPYAYQGMLVDKYKDNQKHDLLL